MKARAKSGGKENRLRDPLGLTDELDSMKEKFKEYVAKTLSSNMDASQVLLSTAMGKLIENDDALKVGLIAIKEESDTTMTTLSTKIDELEEELAACRVVVEQYFRAVGVKNNDTKVNIASMFQELSKGMIVVESLIKLVSRKDKFESFKLMEKGNGGGDEE
ncbi:hypothetical protein CXB51_003073 [Gossypium anomalum]|uniref:Uncharacterized protein n=1 Tax=Gossypium anomalum TaxID=47600 RepID=A0A8J5Z6S2_9ROSI|nr:hypothetical protein CXB51_003073 [Gossypium anomalum]